MGRDGGQEDAQGNSGRGSNKAQVVETTQGPDPCRHVQGGPQTWQCGPRPLTADLCKGIAKIQGDDCALVVNQHEDCPRGDALATGMVRSEGIHQQVARLAKATILPASACCPPSLCFAFAEVKAPCGPFGFT
ncbi:hypothetical protein NL676_012764 [Syzygium grande]|nr:hypothetical protein NL676_012764 [Syzygium grande]